MTFQPGVSLTACHTLASTLLVVSSRMRTCGSRTRALIRAMLCLSPLDRGTPHPPTSAKERKLHVWLVFTKAPQASNESVGRRWELFVPVSYWCLSSERKASALAFLAASITFSKVQSFRPYSMLYRSETENNSRSCDTKASFQEMETRG